MKKILKYTIAASLIFPTTLSYIGSPSVVSANTTPISELPPTSTTTNVANNYKELERLIDVRLLNRESSFELHFNRLGNNSISIENVKNHIHQYMEDPFHFKEAHPYTGWSIKDFEIESINNKEKMTFVIKPTYFTSISQESDVDEQIKKISKDIIHPSMSEFQKTKAIYDYISKEKKLTNDNISSNPESTYALLNYNNGTSRSFALLTLRLLEYNKISSKIIKGNILGDINNNLDVDHFWNLVYLNGSWYNLDSALGAGYTNQTKEFPYQYFLISDSTLKATHNWVGYSTLTATNTQYERYRYWKKIHFSNKRLIYIDGYNLQDQLGVDNKIISGYRVKDFAYDEINNWVYFIGKSNGNYLYKMRPDGTRFEIVSREKGHSVAIEEIKTNGKLTSQRLNYTHISGGYDEWEIEPQIDVDKRKAKEIDDMIMRISPSNPSVQDVAEIRAEYSLLPIDARKYISITASLRWASAQAALTTSQNESANIAVQIALLEELKPTFRTDVETTRNIYNQLSKKQKEDIYNYYELENAEYKVQENLSLAYRLDQDIKALDVDTTKYHNNILQYIERFDAMTFAQQVLVVQHKELFNKKREVLKHTAIAADFDYRVEMLNEHDERIVEKVHALRALYDEIHVVQDRNIKRYNRLIQFERYINKLDSDVTKWRDNTEQLYLHYTEVTSSNPSEAKIISDSFVRNLIDYRKSYKDLKPTEKTMVRSAEIKLKEMEKWAEQTFRTDEVIRLEKEIDKLSIDLREIEERMKPVLEDFYKLPANEQLIISNHTKLLDLESWVIYKKDINAVIKKIDAINRNNAWAKYKNATYEARFAYNSLNEYSKAKIHNYSKLTAAEKDIAKNNGNTTTKPTKPTKDTIVVNGKKQQDGYVFEIDSSTVNQTISPEGTRNLVLKTDDGFKMTLNANNFNHRFARLSEMTVTINQTLDYMVEVQAFLHTGNQKKEIIELYDFAQIEVPTKWLSEDTYNMVILRSTNNDFTATPFYDNNRVYILNTRSLGKFYVRHEDIEFKDVSRHIYEEPIYFLANRHIVKGTSSTTYSPNRSVSRAQFAIMVARALNVSSDEPSQFIDARGTYFESSVQALQQFAIINGTTPDYFVPHRSLSRQQGLLMMGRLLEAIGYELDDSGYEPYLKDWNKMDPEAQRIYIALEHLDLIDVSDGYFNPYKDLSRAEMAHMLTQTLQEAKFY